MSKYPIETGPFPANPARLRYVGGRDCSRDGQVDQSQINWGGHADPRGVLVEGEVYEVDRISVHSSHTRIYLKGHPKHFNSVWFEEAPEGT